MSGLYQCSRNNQSKQCIYENHHVDVKRETDAASALSFTKKVIHGRLAMSLMETGYCINVDVEFNSGTYS